MANPAKGKTGGGETEMEFRIKTESGCTLIFTDETFSDTYGNLHQPKTIPGYRLTIIDASGADMDHSHLIRGEAIKRLAKAS